MSTYAKIFRGNFECLDVPTLRGNFECLLMQKSSGGTLSVNMSAPRGNFECLLVGLFGGTLSVYVDDLPGGTLSVLFCV